jgi:hypothetical protein
MEAEQHEADSQASYPFTGRRSFLNWLRFDQYRKLLLFDEVHKYYVVTDIANFFDTVLHSHVAEALCGVPVPPRMIGLLFFLLEHLSIRQDYSSSHGISLPTDEFDCSRTLAHMVLYPHDAAMVELVGEDRYVRWMDDQNMAVSSKAEGLRVLAEVGRSLARLHLTPNGQKSKILSLEEARGHFHLDLNQALDQAEDLTKRVATSNTATKRLASKVRGIWRRAKRNERIGEFGKILKRIYRLAGLAGLDILRDRAADDIRSDPSLVKRVAGYYRCTGLTSEYLNFVEALMHHPEQVYPDVNVALVESLLRLEPAASEVPRILKLALQILRRKNSFPGAEDCAAIAPLLLLRFGTRKQLPTLRRCFENRDRRTARQVVRAAAIVYASYGLKTFREVRRAAGTMLRNHLSTLVRLVDEIRSYSSVPDRYKARLTLGSDSVAGRKFVDMRVVLMARLLLLSEKQPVRGWVIQWRKSMVAAEISDYDRRLLRRLVK